jgi:hypothetical protein
MKTLREALAIALAGIVLIATIPNARAFQENQQAPLSASDIDAIVSPIALYPDQLVAQILGAATYPDQVTAASNFVNSSGLKDQALMTAVDKQPWDPSVKALTQFPTVLDQMAKNLSWTSALGDASYNQQADVMASIQRLRKQAKDAGNLKNTSQMTVTQQNPQTIVIQPANPQTVYVPTYNPTVVYGTPYQPPGYSTGAMVATGLISFGIGMAVGAAISNNSCCGWGWGGGGWGCNWHGGTVVYQHNTYISRSNTFYGNNRYANNPYYRNNNRYNGGNNRYNGGNNKAAWNSGNRNSGNTVNRGGNTVNINGDVNVGNKSNNRLGNDNNAVTNNNANRLGQGNNNAGNRPGLENAAANRPSTADRGYGQRPQQGNNNSALGGYKQGGYARADANRGRQSFGGSGGGRQAAARGGGRRR